MTQCRIDGRKLPREKPTELRLVADTDRQRLTDIGP